MYVYWLVAAEPAAAPAAQAAGVLTEVRLPEARPGWALEVALPNGIVIRATGAQGMSEVVNALRPC